MTYSLANDQKSDGGLTGVYGKHQQMASVPSRAQGETIPLLFQLLKASHSLRLMAPIFKAEDISTSVIYVLI